MVKDLIAQFEPTEHMLWLMVIAAVLALIVTASSYPAIINVAISKQLMAVPDERSSHSNVVPNLGGIGMYLGIVVTITILGAILDTQSLLLILGGITILFFLGLKDDILILSPRKKFFGQLLAAGLLIVFTDTRIMGFSGLFGVTILPYLVSVLFTLFVYVLIINAINLIDGIDGLAGGIVWLSCMVYAYCFYQLEDYSMLVLAATTAGSLIPFLYLNFSRHRKLFMGDTGSMILGFIVAVLTVRFISGAQLEPAQVFNKSAPILALAILFFPLLDTLRIFFIRLVVHKTSPFTADKNHLHHCFLRLGFSHVQTTVIILGLNILVIAIAFSDQSLNIHWQLILLCLGGVVLFSAYFIYRWLLRLRRLKIRSKARWGVVIRRAFGLF